MKKTFKLLCAASVTVCSLFANLAHADELATIKARGTLVCGVLSTLPPFGFQDPNTRAVVGYDIDFCKGVAKELGVKAELKVMSLDSRIPELTQGRVDILAAVLGYNAQRAQQIAFSNTYFVSEQVMAVKSGSPYKHTDDLAGKRISTIKGSSNIPVIHRVLPTAQLVSYDDGPSPRRCRKWLAPAISCSFADKHRNTRTCNPRARPSKRQPAASSQPSLRCWPNSVWT